MGEDTSNSSSTTTTSSEISTQNISAYFVLFLTILALALVLSNLLHHMPVANKLGEVGIILILGMIAGSIVNLFVDSDPVPMPSANNDDQFTTDGSVALSLLSFSPQVFFVALLPPIIFNSGYHLKRELFFRHIAPVMLFAVVGTLVSALAISFTLQLAKEFGCTGDFQPSECFQLCNVVYGLFLLKIIELS